MKDPAFESGIVKIISQQTDAMNEQERKSCEIFIHEEQSIAPSTASSSFAAEAVKKARAALENKRKYIDLTFIPPTTNIVERLFNECRLILTDYRSCMHPDTFQDVMMLKANRTLWNVTLIQKL